MKKILFLASIVAFQACFLHPAANPLEETARHAHRKALPEKNSNWFRVSAPTINRCASAMAVKTGVALATMLSFVGAYYAIELSYPDNKSPQTGPWNGNVVETFVGTGKLLGTAGAGYIAGGLAGFALGALSKRAYSTLYARRVMKQFEYHIKPDMVQGPHLAVLQQNLKSMPPQVNATRLFGGDEKALALFQQYIDKIVSSK